MKLTRSIVFLFAAIFACIVVHISATEASSPDAPPHGPEHAPVVAKEGKSATILKKCEAGITKATEFVPLTGDQKKQYTEYLKSRGTREALVSEAKIFVVFLLLTVAAFFAIRTKLVLENLVMSLGYNVLATFVTLPIPHKTVRLFVRSMALVGGLAPFVVKKVRSIQDERAVTPVPTETTEEEHEKDE